MSNTLSRQCRLRTRGNSRKRSVTWRVGFRSSWAKARLCQLRRSPLAKDSEKLFATPAPARTSKNLPGIWLLGLSRLAKSANVGKRSMRSASTRLSSGSKASGGSRLAPTASTSSGKSERRLRSPWLRARLCRQPSPSCVETAGIRLSSTRSKQACCPSQTRLRSEQRITVPRADFAGVPGPAKSAPRPASRGHSNG